MSVTYAPQEQQYYDRLFATIDKENAGVIPGHDALPFLVSSNLPQQILGEIWALADPENNGFLTKDGWYRAARLIGWMQNGNQSAVEESLTIKPGPYPTFSGQLPPPSQAPPIQAPSFQTPPSQAPTKASTLPPLTPADRTKFTRIFVGCSPQNGLVSGEKARDVFVKSQLSYDKLGQIWNLSDTQQRGSLDLTDFIIGMYLIQSSMANPSLSLPARLPPDTYSQASGGRPLPSSPLTPQRTGSSLRGPGSPLQPQPTGASTRLHNSSRWDVTPEAKATSDQFFAQLDTRNVGVIEGDVAVPFMVQSQLDEGVLATIWDLADIRHEGKLDKDQFAVAMHLINAKLAGKDIPAVLPISLIPPALRDVAGQQEVLDGPSNVTKDLFDLFDDPPALTPASASVIPSPPSRRGTGSKVDRSTARATPPPASVPPSAFTPSQANSGDDLLGDESTPVPADSAALGNIQNQLSNTTRSLAGLTKTRSELEQTALTTQDQLTDLESKLSAARSKHEAETKAVADLRSRVGEQTSRLKALQADVITAESDVSALRSEKDELEQALLHDKEEVRGLQKRMKEVEEEKGTLKDLLEKLRKEARQQKGMVTIAKKQLSTAEISRDTVQKDIDTEGQSPIATVIPLPATPQALSPVPTGLSQRSNNPFERLRATPSEPSKPVILSTTPTNFDDAFAGFNEEADDTPVLQTDAPGSSAMLPNPTEPQENLADGSASRQDYITAGNADRNTGSDTSFPVTSETQFEPTVEGATILRSPPIVAAEEEPTAVVGPDPSSDAATGQIAKPSPPISRDEIVSSDEEDEGPEDLENPTRSYDKPTLADPIPADVPTSRRSAPPPPSHRVQELDPFGVPGSDSTTQPQRPSATSFDEEDFDFSDSPPAPINGDNAPISRPATFDDEFAGFDDEFGTSQVNSGSDASNSMSKSYEMVSPQAPKNYDEWGFGQSAAATPGGPKSALSFDDAFGGDFEPPVGPPLTEVTSKPNAAEKSPEIPVLPERRGSQAQNDDIEDVKKLCAMGFPRTLVVDALDANGYDFQKTLNVLLAQ